MLYENEGFLRRCKRAYGVEDITMVVAIRAHESNPWVLERLSLLTEYYVPAPRVIVVDFGSAPEYRRKIESVCRNGALTYEFVDDSGVFSLAKARNIGAAKSETALIFFSDIDCFGERSMFASLVAAANAQDMGAYFDQTLILPVYHLTEETSRVFFDAENNDARSAHLGHAFFQAAVGEFGTHAEYVDPHSNFFLIRRDFFDYIGGINENFRGHGSEDFEFFLRLAVYALQFPLPDNPMEDVYGPRHPDFFGSKSYRGFRRLLALMAQPAELAGLRIAHLHHARGKDNTGWYESNDWRRKRFTDQVEPFLSSRLALLGYDWMPRKKRALVLVKHESHADQLFPLRMAGYSLIPVRAGDAESMERGVRMLEDGQIDAVAIFNPYMKSHVELRMFFEVARKTGIRTIVIERGVLPESWYYAEDMSHADPEFASLDVQALRYSPDELTAAAVYISKLRGGASTLEANGDYAETFARLSIYRRAYTKVCVIPLQLDDDVAVTRFAAGYQPYADFLSHLAGQVAAHPDILFFIKTHPLSGKPFQLEGENVVVCGARDNIHALIELSDAVICYNSGVGLLGLAHHKRVATVGNAFYNVPGLGVRVRTLADAIESVFAPGAEAPPEHLVVAFVAWLLFSKYSFFRGESVIRDFGARKAHGYKNLLWYHLNVEGQSHSAMRVGVSAKAAYRSHIAARLQIGDELTHRSEAGLSVSAKSAVTPSNAAGRARPLRGRKKSASTAGSKLRKLVRNPQVFLADSQFAPLRWVGGTLFASATKDAGKRGG